VLINYLRPSSASLLLLCGFLFVFTETLLSPFYPQFFAQVFGVTDPGMAGEFVTLCRLSVLLCAPLWGLMTRWVSPLKILIFTQSTAAVITFFMAQASTLKAFVILSVLLMAFKSSYFLFYSLLVELGGQAKNLQSVASVQLVVHLALIASSLGSVWVINSVNPLAMFQFVAALDVLQVGLCYWVLSRANSSHRQDIHSTAPSLGERTAPSRAQQTGHPQPQNDQQNAHLPKPPRPLGVYQLSRYVNQLRQLIPPVLSERLASIKRATGNPTDQAKALEPTSQQDAMTAPKKARTAQLLSYAVLVLLFALSLNLLRPYLTLYLTQELHFSQWQAAAAYLMPSVMAIAIYLGLRMSKHSQIHPKFYLTLIATIAISLIAQVWVSDFWAMLLVRGSFGMSLLLAQITLETRLFTLAGDQKHIFLSLSSSAQHLGQLLAPFLAAVAIASVGLQVQFWLATLLLLICAPFVRSALYPSPTFQSGVTYVRPSTF